MTGGVPWLHLLKIVAIGRTPDGDKWRLSSFVVHSQGRIGLFSDQTENFLRDAEYRPRLTALLTQLPWQGTLTSGISAIREEQIQGTTQTAATPIRQPLHITPAEDGALLLSIGGHAPQQLRWRPGAGRLEAVPASR